MEFIALKATQFPKNQILQKLEEHNILINQYAEEFFAHPTFSTEHTKETTIAIASLREIGLENGATLNEIFQQIEKTCFKACATNTGLFLRFTWKNQPQSQNSILSGTHCSPEQAVVVLSEIIERDDAFPKGLYLRNVDGRLWLRGYMYVTLSIDFQAMICLLLKKESFNKCRIYSNRSKAEAFASAFLHL